jgi:hypothetical protein
MEATNRAHGEARRDPAERRKNMKQEPNHPTDIQIAALKRVVANMESEDLADLLMKAVPAPVLEDAVAMLSGFFDSPEQMLKEGRTPPSYGLCLAD